MLYNALNSDLIIEILELLAILASAVSNLVEYIDQLRFELYI
jgi:hypothetical protein